MATLLLILLSLILGSFNNVLISRVPEKRSILGRSRCPMCEYQLTWYHNIPLISYIALKGNCYNCNNEIPRTYILIEIASLILCLPILTLPNQYILKISQVIFVSISVALVKIDWKTYTLPNLITYPLFTISFLCSLTYSLTYKDWNLLKQSLTVSVILFTFYYLIHLISNGGMGLGDAKYSATVGLLVGQIGYMQSYFASMLSFFLGSAYGLWLIFRRKASRKSTVPFGPFIFLGAYLVLLGDNFI